MFCSSSSKYVSSFKVFGGLLRESFANVPSVQSGTVAWFRFWFPYLEIVEKQNRNRMRLPPFGSVKSLSRRSLQNEMSAMCEWVQCEWMRVNARQVRRGEANKWFRIVCSMGRILDAVARQLVMLLLLKNEKLVLWAAMTRPQHSPAQTSPYARLAVTHTPLYAAKLISRQVGGGLLLPFFWYTLTTSRVCAL